MYDEQTGSKQWLVVEWVRIYIHNIILIFSERGRGSATNVWAFSYCCWRWYYLSGPSTPAWVIKSAMLFSRSSIRVPISSIRVIIWSDIDWNLSWTFCKRFCTWETDKNNLAHDNCCLDHYSRKLLAPACFWDRRCLLTSNFAQHRCQYPISDQPWCLLV